MKVIRNGTTVFWRSSDDPNFLFCFVNKGRGSGLTSGLGGGLGFLVRMCCGRHSADVRLCFVKPLLDGEQP